MESILISPTFILFLTNSEIFRKAPNFGIDPELAVATGVSVQADVLSGGWPLKVAAVELGTGLRKRHIYQIKDNKHHIESTRLSQFFSVVCLYKIFDFKIIYLKVSRLLRNFHVLLFNTGSFLEHFRNALFFCHFLLNSLKQANLFSRCFHKKLSVELIIALVIVIYCQMKNKDIY